MSNSDFDSDGFESAEDDDFEIRQPTTRKHSDTVKPSKSDETAEKVKDSTDRNKSEAKTTEDGWNDDEDNWGWNDDSDNKKPAKASGSAQVTTTTAAADKLTNKVKALDVQDDWNDNEDNWGWNEDKNDSGFKSEPKPKLDNSQANADRPNAAALDVLQNRGQRNISESGLGQGTGVENAPAWSPWSGMVSFLSTASTNVASFTSHVSSVIESNIGVPDPELFAQQQASEKTATPATAPLPSANDETVATTMLQDEKLLNLGSFVSNMTSISNRVIAGGLDTLEGIGKKTMTILQENDAGLISKRRLLGLDNPKPVLSQILREAKEKSEEMEKTMNMSQKRSFRKQLHFETLFDDYHGLVHLEALEMLSKQASLKLQTLLMPLTGNALNELQQTMSSVNELCELNESDLDETPSLLYDATELDERLKAAVEDFDVPMDFTDILELVDQSYDVSRPTLYMSLYLFSPFSLLFQYMESKL